MRVIQHDAVEVVAAMIPPALARRRPRLLPRPVAEEAPSQAAAAVSRRSCTRSRERLAPGGYLHVATDWDDYAQEILATLAAEPLLANTAAGLRAAPAVAAADQVRGARAKLGHAVHDLVFNRHAG